MRVVFAGTPAFAARSLEAILAAGHAVPLVLTQPDRPAGRGLRLAESAVSRVAAANGIETFKPASLKDEAACDVLSRARGDVMVVAAYGLLLPPAILAIPLRGCLNIHASLLPRWRGAAPVQRALLAGDAQTGISIMQMDAGLDTGPVLLESKHPIGARDNAGRLTEALASLGAEAIVAALASLDTLRQRPQDDALATYAAKVDRDEARIDWTRACLDVDRQIRAFNPAPGAETAIDGDVLKIWEAEPAPDTGRPGEIVRAGNGQFVIACGIGSIALRTLQRAGGKRMASGDFLRGARVTRGALLAAT